MGSHRVDGLAQAIARLVDHLEIRLVQGRQNRGIVERKFSDQNLRELIRVFNSTGRVL